MTDHRDRLRKIHVRQSKTHCQVSRASEPEVKRVSDFEFWWGMIGHYDSEAILRMTERADEAAQRLESLWTLSTRVATRSATFISEAIDLLFCADSGPI